MNIWIFNHYAITPDMPEGGVVWRYRFGEEAR